MEDLKPILLKLMPKLSNAVRSCVNKVWKQNKPQNIEQFIYLVDKCLKDKAGVSDAERLKEVAELNKLKSQLEKELEEIKTLLDMGKELEKKSTKIPPKRPQR